MFKHKWPLLTATAGLSGVFVGVNSVEAQTADDDSLDLLQKKPMSQVTSVNQLRDVEPTAWAFEALRSLVERYGCIVGYPVAEGTRQRRDRGNLS